MNGLWLLWTTYSWLPEAVVLDLIALQLGLRLRFYRSQRKSSRGSRTSAPPGTTPPSAQPPEKR